MDLDALVGRMLSVSRSLPFPQTPKGQALPLTPTLASLGGLSAPKGLWGGVGVREWVDWTSWAGCDGFAPLGDGLEVCHRGEVVLVRRRVPDARPYHALHRAMAVAVGELGAAGALFRLEDPQGRGCLGYLEFLPTPRGIPRWVARSLPLPLGNTSLPHLQGIEALLRGEGGSLTLGALRKAFSLGAFRQGFLQGLFRALAGRGGGGLSERPSLGEGYPALLEVVVRTLFLGLLSQGGWLAGREDFLGWLLQAYREEGHWGSDRFYPEWLDPLWGILGTPPAQRGGPPPHLPEPVRRAYGELPHLGPFLTPPSPLKGEAPPPPVPDALVERLFRHLFAYPMALEEAAPSSASLSLGPEALGLVLEAFLRQRGAGGRGLGAHYTPELVVDRMARLALGELLYRRGLPLGKAYALMRGDPGALSEGERLLAREVLGSARILDPAVGAGAFLAGVLRVLEEALDHLGEPEGAERRAKILARLHGVDAHPWAVWVARLRLGLALASVGPKGVRWEEASATLQGNLVHGDFLVPGEGEGWRGRADLVIGNPPYVRHEAVQDPLGRFPAPLYRELLRKGTQEALRRVAARGGEAPPRASGKSDLFAHFYAHSLALLPPHGVLAFLTSNAWLDAGYGAWLREVFTRHAPLRYVIEHRWERTFEADVRVAVTVSWAPTGVPEGWEVRFVAVEAPFEEVDLLEALGNGEGARQEGVRVRVVGVEALREGGRVPLGGWGGAHLRAPDLFFHAMEALRERLVPLVEVAEVWGGVRTGANPLFHLHPLPYRPPCPLCGRVHGEALTALEEGAYRAQGRPLPEGALVAVANGLGWKGYIEGEALVPLLRGPRELPDWPLEVLPAWLRVRLFFPPEPLPPHAEAYAAWGEREGRTRWVSLAGKVPWWRLPTHAHPPNVVCMTSYHRRFGFWLNRHGVAGNRLCVLRPKLGVGLEALSVALNWEVVFLQQSLLGRGNLGAGGVDLGPQEMRRLWVPDPRAIPEPRKWLARLRALRLGEDRVEESPHPLALGTEGDLRRALAVALRLPEAS